MHTSNPSTHLVLAYYTFTPIKDPIAEVKLHKQFLKDKDFTCRIYVSEAGINGQSSGTVQDATAYMEWMHGREEFKNIRFKIHSHNEQAFPRQTIKYKQKLVAIDEKVDMSKTATHLSPKKWKEMLGNKEKVLLDVRNDYEWKIGRFEGATLPPCETFREFAEYADQLKETSDPKTTPVMMYCTGGIRCELYSAILKEKGFEEVYQLDGGVIGYGLEEGNDHWLGKLFVFDDRLSVPISNEGSAPIIGACLHCNCPSDAYYNCADMDCNTLFICCPSCLKEFQGCCCSRCQEAPRRRPYHETTVHKPFRRAHTYKSLCLSPNSQ